MIGVYAIINSVTNKRYIGSSVNIERRIKTHFYELGKNSHNNAYLQNAYNKNGKDAFTVVVLEECKLENVRERENYYINLFNSANSDFGYNILSDANIGVGVSMSDEVKKQISIACSGSKNGNFGRKHTEEELQRMRDNRWGVGYIKRPRKRYPYKPKNPPLTKEQRSQIARDRMTPEVREKLSIANKGKIVSEETKMKQSLHRRGEDNANNKLSKETVFNIYNELSSGVHYMDVCKKYGICVSTCYKIKRKEYWCFDKQ